MAKHSKKEFAGLCGISTRELSVYIKRGKIVLTGDQIDDSLEINKDFIDRKNGKKEPKAEPEKKLRMIRPDPGIDDSDDEDEDAGIGDDSDNDASGYALDKKKLRRQISKLEVDTRLQRLKEEKLRGELVPVDLIRNLFRAHTQSIITAQKDGIEDLLINLSVEARLKGDQLARLRGKMVEILNTGVDRAIAATQKTLKTAVDEISVKKGVGEHG